MAITKQRTDDLNGATDDVQPFTVTKSDGSRVRVDLGAASRAEYDEMLDDFLDGKGEPVKTAADRERTAAVRAWARESGKFSDLGDRGPVPAAAFEAYDAAHPAGS